MKKMGLLSLGAITGIALVFGLLWFAPGRNAPVASATTQRTGAGSALAAAPVNDAGPAARPRERRAAARGLPHRG